MGSDQIIRWNTAKELSKKWSKSPDDKHRLTIPEITLNDVQRWSWAVKGNEGSGIPSDTPISQHVSYGNEDDAIRSQRLDSVATSIIDRRLSQAQRLVRTKHEAHRQRRSLKESGDYLGVQGFNPETGEFDVITPTESEESNAPLKPTGEHFNKTRLEIESCSQLPPEQQKEIKKLRLAIQEEKLRRLDAEKQQLRDIGASLKWRRKTKQWSSAHEPALSTIAQSQTSSSPSDNGTFRSFTSFSSETDILAVAHSRSPQQADLVDIYSSPLSPSGSEDGRGSCRTVLRTPHRLSLAEASPSALELFENGISFDHSNDSKLREDDTISGQSAWMNSPGAISPTSQVAEYKPPLASNQYNIATNVSPSEKSFLGPGTIAKLDPGGKTGSSIQPLRLKTNKNRTKLLPQKKSFRSLFKKNSGSIVRQPKAIGGLMTPQTDGCQMEGDPIRHKQMRCPMDFEAIDPGQENLHGFQKRSKTFLRTLNSMTNLHRTQALTPPREIAFGPATQYSSESVRKDMMKLREKLGDLDRMDLGVRRGHAAQCDTDNEWIEDTMRDITRKGLEAFDDCAYTPTTTTTGYDQQESYLKEKGENGLQPDLRIQEANEQTESVCAQPARGPSEHNKGHFPEKPHQNTSVNEQGMPHHIVPGTISTSHLTTTRQRVESLVKESVAPTRPVARSDEGYKCSNLETELHQDKEGKLMEHKPRWVSQESAVMGSPAMLTMETAPVARRRANPSLILIPGSFPGHPGSDGSDGIENLLDEKDLSKPTSEANATQQGGECLEVDGVLYGLHKQGLFLMKLYWRIVRPVFDPHSVYWQRQAKQEATALDSVVLLMALPGVILATAVVVWAMRMAAFTGVYIRNAVGSFGSEVLYLLGG